MRYNIGAAPNSLGGLIAQHFATGVRRRSNGALEIEIYPNGQLANQQVGIEMVAEGALDFTQQASSLLVPLAPGYQVLDLPFLFEDLAAGYRVVDGPIGKSIASGLESHGIVSLAWEINGMKAMETSPKPVVNPEDLKGMRMRIQGGPVFVAMYQSLGAVPVVIDVGEVYTAFQQRVIDGMDVTLDAFVASKWYGVAKHVAITNHVLSSNPVIGSKKKIEALPPALQTIVREEGRTADLYARSLLQQRMDESVAVLKRNGVTFTQVQHAAFRTATEPVYASVQAKLGGDLIDRISRAASQRGRR